MFFAQMDSLTIRNFEIEDYADVVSRGFIEGYYGNPWSTEDRVNLMKWGGYYKLNAYFYAPKDDPKHRTQWDQLIRKKSWQIRSDRLQRREMNQNADLFMPFIRSRRQSSSF